MRVVVLLALLLAAVVYMASFADAMNAIPGKQKRFITRRQPKTPEQMAIKKEILSKLSPLRLPVGTASSGCGNAGPGFPVGQQTQATMMMPTGPREFLVYVPPSYNFTHPSGVQFTFHGLGDNCHNFIDATDFKPYADQTGYILIAPCGTVGLLLENAWNSGECCGFLDEQHPNDFLFARNMVQNISNSMCVDTTKIVATGFSNGAFMSEVLGCESPDLFRGVAAVSGVVELRPGNDAAIARCSENITMSTRRPEILLVHGDLDLVVPWTGESVLGFPTVPKDAEGWYTRNGCNPNPTQTLNLTYYTNQVWNNCNGWGGTPANSVELVRHHDGGHVWPDDSEMDVSNYIFNWMMRLWQKPV